MYVAETPFDELTDLDEFLDEADWRLDQIQEIKNELADLVYWARKILAPEQFDALIADYPELKDLRG